MMRDRETEVQELTLDQLEVVAGGSLMDTVKLMSEILLQRQQDALRDQHDLRAQRAGVSRRGGGFHRAIVALVTWITVGHPARRLS